MRSAGLLVALILAGCHGYRAGSFVGPFGPLAGEQRTVGCLDVAVAPARDGAAQGPVAELNIANRCDAGVVVDVGSIRVTGRTPDGTETRLAAFDPAGEIRPALLEARCVAHEYIEYQPISGDDLSLSEWCVDLARLDRARPSDRPVLVCFAGGVGT